MQVSKAHYTYIIIGNGIAGTTAARELRKRTQASILIISDETPYFYSRTALMYVLKIRNLMKTAFGRIIKLTYSKIA